MTTLSSSRPSLRFWKVPAICAARNGATRPGRKATRNFSRSRGLAQHRGGQPGVLAPRAGRRQGGLEAVVLGGAGDLGEVGDVAGRPEWPGAIPWPPPTTCRPSPPLVGRNQWKVSDTMFSRSVDRQVPASAEAGRGLRRGGCRRSRSDRGAGPSSAAGSCRVWVRALRQCRSRTRDASEERVPHTSNSRLPASTDAVVDAARAAATARLARAAGRLVEVVVGAVDRPPGLAEERLGAADLELELAERVHHQGILGRALDLGVRVGTALRGHELGRVRERRAGDADVDRGMQQLGERAERLGPLEREVVRRDQVAWHPDLVEPHRPARRRPLPDAVPVVDHRRRRVRCARPTPRRAGRRRRDEQAPGSSARRVLRCSSPWCRPAPTRWRGPNRSGGRSDAGSSRGRGRACCGSLTARCRTWRRRAPRRRAAPSERRCPAPAAR